MNGDMTRMNVSTFIGCGSDFENADIVIFGAGFDGTTSYRPGTRFAPGAVRNESYGIETYSPYQNKDLNDYRIFDSGDLELPFGNTDRVIRQIMETETRILEAGKIPVMIGGEHLVTYGAVRAVNDYYSDKLHIIHFDAHADLRNDYLEESLSHACVIRRCWELVGDGRIFQFGIRSGDREEFEWAEHHHTYMNKFNFDTLPEVVSELKEKNTPVYFTIDLDVLDPSEFPGTGTPEAGGVRFTDLVNAVIEVSQLNIVGADITELSPPYDPSGISTALACKTLRELLLSLTK